MTSSFSAEVEAAVGRLAGVATPTPVQRNARLSALTGADVWFKREDLQVGRSYKVRGAYNTIAQLGRGGTAVTASAGNHGQGFAYACKTLGVQGHVFVPGTTPKQKRQRIAALGGDAVTLVVEGDTYDDAARAAAEHAATTGATLVPAFDALSTVAGQATVAVEFLAQLPVVPDVVVLPVGGGGLLAGCATWLAEHAPGTRVVGVEPVGAANMAAALAAGEPVTLEQIETFVDGAAVRRAGDVTYPLVRDSGAELVTVPEGQICTEMLELYQVDGVIAEPAGALASAALTGGAVVVETGQTVLCVLSGGNNDVSRYAEVVERSLVHRGLKHYFLVEFPQEPGALRRFLDEVLGPDDDIVLFEYVKRDNRETGAALTGIELGSVDGLAPLLARIEAGPLKIEHLAPGTTAYRFLV